MYKILLIILLIPASSLSCQESKYPAYVGDIAFNKETDRADFELTSDNGRIYQYFNNLEGLEYEGEKLAIEKEFSRRYNCGILKNETGLIRINFVVNYKGETDRFRLIAMDGEYNEKAFSPLITRQLMEITKSLKGWKPKKNKGQEIDYYQYLTFKIEDGQLKEILP